MAAGDLTSCYAVGSAQAEARTPLRKAAGLAPLTEPLLRDAGIGAANASYIKMGLGRSKLWWQQVCGGNSHCRVAIRSGFGLPPLCSAKIRRS